VGSFFSAIGSFIGGFFSAIGGFFSGFFGGAFGRGGSSGGSGGSSGGSSGGGGSMSVLPQSSRAGSGPSSSEVSQSFIASAYNFGSSVGSALGGAFRAATANIGGASFEGASNWLSGKGFRTDFGVTIHGYERQIEMIRALCGNVRDAIIDVISRPLSKNLAGDPGSTTGPRHNAIISDMLSYGKWEMGANPESHFIETTSTIQNLSKWDTHITTEKSLALGGSYIRSFNVDVNVWGLQEAIGVYETTFVGKVHYNALNHNSNYAVNSVIYGAGGDVPVGHNTPGFPDNP
jgi:hypothetical protein